MNLKMTLQEPPITYGSATSEIDHLLLSPDVDVECACAVLQYLHFRFKVRHLDKRKNTSGSESSSESKTTKGCEKSYLYHRL